MTELIQVKDGMTSQEIAEVTGKRHADIMRDIKNLLEQGISERNFALSSRKQPQPNGGFKEIPIYHLTPKGVLILASGYNALLREKIINRLEELEAERRKQPMPTTSFPDPQPEGIVFWHDGARVVSSRTLAMMCGREHSDMMRSVRNAYRLLDRPRRSFIERREGERTREILVTVKGFKALRQVCVSMSSEVAAEVSAAFTRAKRGIFTPPVPKVPAPPVASMPATPEEMLRRFTKAIAVMMGIDPESVSGLMQKGGAL